MSKYEPRISSTSNGFYALVVRIDNDGEVSVIHGYKGRHFATMKAAQRSTSAHIAKIKREESAKERYAEDERLMRLAARAAGVELAEPSGLRKADCGEWNPLRCTSSDSLLLVAQLGMQIGQGWAKIGNGPVFQEQVIDGRWLSATRRAIVRAAASLVKPQP